MASPARFSQVGPFEEALAFVLAREGGYSNDPRDPGKETHFGISKAAYPDEDIANLTLARATFLYKRDYWDRARCGDFPRALGMALFDSAVNQGIGPAVRLMQRALMVTEDGIVGHATLEAAFHRDLRTVLRDFIRRRELRYMRHPQAETFIGGWLDRCLLCFEACLKAIP